MTTLLAQAVATALVCAVVAALIASSPAIARRRSGVPPAFLVLALVLVGVLRPSGFGAVCIAPADALLCALPALLTYRSFVGRLVVEAAVWMAGIATLTVSVRIIAGLSLPLHLS